MSSLRSQTVAQLLEGAVEDLRDVALARPWALKSMVEELGRFPDDRDA